MKLLVVVDMQNDFIDGSLGSETAQAIVPNVVKKIADAKNNHEIIIATQDTHYSDYLNTLEGKNLPIKHCIANSDGWQINDLIYNQLNTYDKVKYIAKPTFGSYALMNYIKALQEIYDTDKELIIDIIGLMLNICVISNAIILKTYFPNAAINVDISCTAATSPEAYDSSISILESCQINVYK